MDNTEKSTPPIAEPPTSRREIMRRVGVGAILATAGLSLPSVASAQNRNQVTNLDIFIAQFALNLEYLEAEFYSFITTGAGIPAQDTTGLGRPGETTGGSQLIFSDPTLEATANELNEDEGAHVRFLRQTLGAKRVAKPAIALDALGIGFADETEFLTLSRAFEDTGVSAYGALAPLINSKAILAGSARIAETEAYHAGNIRLQVILRGLDVPPLDSLDQPPTVANQIPTDSQGLAVIRTVNQVLAIVTPFFPNGPNLAYGRL